jgi:serine/threonine-protein kinase PpkA
MQIEIPGYTIISTLGQGGMATVYLAIQTCFEREVALKVMAPHLSTDPAFGERFLREARIVSRLKHPNIVTVYDVGIHAGFHYLAMEYLPGRDLKHKRFELNLVEALQVINDVAHALDYAGRKGYVHRDVKPENIMLLEEGGRAVLMDFGVARAADLLSGMTQTGIAVGTPHYMSPEQARGSVVDHRADLYSLGVVFFVLLTGDLPYDAGSAVGVGIKHISEPIPRLPEHLSIFQPIVDRALAKNPNDRYQSGSEFIADLDGLPAPLVLLAMELNELPPTLDDDPHSPTMIKPRPILTDEQLAGMDARTPGESSGFSAILDDVTAQGLYASLNSTGVDTHMENLSLSEADIEAHRHHSASGREKKNRLSPSFLMLGLLIVSGAYWLSPGISDYWQDDQPQQPATEHNHARIYGTDRVVPSVSAVDKAVEKTSAEAQVINGTDVTVDNFQQKTQQLRIQLDEDVSMAGELASVYQAALDSTDPELQNLGHAGLQEMQAFYVARINALINASELAQAQAYAGSAQRLFAEPRRVLSLVEALAAVDSAAELMSVLSQAENYLQQGALDAPEGSNALESYRSVLRDYPEHPLALAGLHNIARAYHEQAQIQAEQGAISAALQLNERALALAPTDEPLLAQQQSLNVLHQQHQAEEQLLLSEARSQHLSGKVISPRGDNAYETYTTLLTSNPDNQQAQEGLASLEQTLITRINGQIQRRRFTEALTDIFTAREYFPHSQALLAMNVRVEEMVKDNGPDIVRVIINNHKIKTMDTEQASSIAAAREIYIGFEYANFKQGTSVVQAVLYDGARSLQIAQVPVIVDGEKGTHFFRIEEPLAGFAEGGYSIDLLLDNQPLHTAQFNVKR